MPAWPEKMFIDGKWVDGHSSTSWTITNPATREPLAEIAMADASDVDLAVTAARRAFDEGEWRRMDGLERGRLLFKLAERVRESAEDLAMTDTLNIGKPIRDTLGFDIPCGADMLESYAGLPDKIAGHSYGGLADNVTMQFREPMGVIAAIVPWNYPLTNAAIKLAPILACGNTVVLKPSEVSPLSALMLAKLAEEVGFPPGVINVIHGTGAEAGAALVKHPGINKIAFTGRHETGAQLMEAAKEGMKGVLLELGGKTPSVVFPDAPLDHVVNGVITGIFCHLGQICVAGSRLLVHESQHDELLERIIAKAQSLRQGDPTDPEMHLGCLATPTHCDFVRSRVEQAKQEGARMVLSGEISDDPLDCFFPPTIFDQVSPDMAVAKEEVFGPVLSVMTFKTEEEAIRIANDSDFGLMANIWSTDGTRALRVARELQAGRISINGGGYLRPNVPIYGYKKSGFGAELGFIEAAHELCNSKSVIYSLATEKSPWPE
ncbi:MAG: aldehyde dehydrogenase [Gimesia sp.]|uniref:Aldehyde dehydrogenase n=2 Tax=Gimesia TaxID=1649453 RepID=A0A6I6AK58_9PLAN|nr:MULTISPECIES: aldehyde dehydrogenase family protein [Gimesia]MBN71759.1 aldehyde dehydrogenase [Gimesia sp.]MCR9230055.1 aldehyde dehydrogenase family protein [bacterium]KAA0137024.1 aldehyde dehydrogenase [Gimesia chilikensis]QDU03708.1 Aldehyde dehydrogenase PuuC [Gimesia chilikensis]QGQ26526.1 aldehyde dehydrogenase [Gimesia benthica]